MAQPQANSKTNPTTTSIVGPAKWAAVGALVTASGAGALWSLTRQPAPTSTLPPPPAIVTPSQTTTQSREPVLISQLPEKQPDPAPTPTPAPQQFIESPNPKVISPSTIGPPLPTEPKPEPKSEPKADPKPDPKPDVTPAPKSDPKPTPKPDPKPATKLININTASSAEIELLPDIGPSLAQRIIEHRTKNGPFQSLADLDKVRGIGPKTIEKLRDRIVFK